MILVIHEFYDGITARGICHVEMIVAVVIRYPEVISVQNLESFIHSSGMIQHHAQGNGCSQFLSRTSLLGRFAVEMEHGNGKASLVHTVHQEIWECHDIG